MLVLEVPGGKLPPLLCAYPGASIPLLEAGRQGGCWTRAVWVVGRLSLQASWPSSRLRWVAICSSHVLVSMSWWYFRFHRSMSARSSLRGASVLLLSVWICASWAPKCDPLSASVPYTVAFRMSCGCGYRSPDPGCCGAG